jgi:hypothetical protein
MANDHLLFYLKVYSVLALDLLNNPSNAIDTCLCVNVATRPSDPIAHLQALTRGEDRDMSSPVMLQVGKIEKEPLVQRTTPAMRMSLAGLASSGFGDWPVVMLVFTSDGTNVLSYPCPIHPEALKQGRELNPFVMKSGLMGVYEVPVTEKSIIEYDRFIFCLTC